MVRDANGRNWHHFGVGCTKTRIDTTKAFTLYLIRKIKNNTNNDETASFVWDIQLSYFVQNDSN